MNHNHFPTSTTTTTITTVRIIDNNIHSNNSSTNNTAANNNTTTGVTSSNSSTSTSHIDTNQYFSPISIEFFQQQQQSSSSAVLSTLQPPQATKVIDRLTSTTTTTVLDQNLQQQQQQDIGCHNNNALITTSTNRIIQQPTIMIQKQQQQKDLISSSVANDLERMIINERLSPILFIDESKQLQQQQHQPQDEEYISMSSTLLQTSYSNNNDKNNNNNTNHQYHHNIIHRNNKSNNTTGTPNNNSHSNSSGSGSGSYTTVDHCNINNNHNNNNTLLKQQQQLYLHRNIKISSQMIGYIDYIGIILCTISGSNLIIMLFYDLFYNSNNTKNNEDAAVSSSSSMWTLPYCIPSYNTLLHFGALSFQNLKYDTYNNYEYYNEIDNSNQNIQKQQLLILYQICKSCIISLFICTSLLEWFIILIVWRILYRVLLYHTIMNMKNNNIDYNSNIIPITPLLSWYQIIFYYCISIWVGQLWMYTFDTTTTTFVIVGCISWGTCSIVCIFGILYPMYRFELFIIASLLVIVSFLLRPYSSVYGTTISAFFGWSIASCQYIIQKNKQHSIKNSIHYIGNHNDIKNNIDAVTFIGTASIVLLISIPVMFIAFQ